MNGNMTLAQMARQGREFVLRLTPRQRWVLGGGTALVALTLAVFVSLLSKPEYKTLYSGLAPADTQALAAQLKAKNIRFELSADSSSILVPADQLDSARLEVASQPLPRSGRMGFELFDKPNWAGSDFSERVNYQRALEAELERTLQTLTEVEAVRVHIVMPPESIYSGRERTAKASVMVKLHPGHLPEEADLAIRQLVAGAVDRLAPENVVVVDAETNLPLGRRQSGESAVSDLDQELAKRVVATLEPIVGASGVRASVHVEYDLTSGEETRETYDPASSVPLSMMRSEERLGSEGPGGIAGTSGNLPNAKVSLNKSTSSSSHGSTSESGTYAVNKVVRHTLEPAGRIQRIAAALLVDDAVEISTKNGQWVTNRRKRTPEEMKQIEGLARAALSLDTRRGDLLAVENLSFQGVDQPAAAAPSRFERLQRSLRSWAWLLRYAALGLLFGAVYLLLFRPVKKEALTALRQLPAKLAAPKLAANPSGGADVAKGLEGGSEAANGDGDASSKRLAALKGQLVEKVKQEPAGAIRLVQNWLHEGGVE